MGALTLVKPIAYVASGSMAGAERVATPDPKEAAVAGGGGARYIDLDFAQPATFDTIFVGYTNLPATGAGSLITVQAGNATPTDAWLGSFASAPGDGGGPQHILCGVAVQTSRYLRISQQDMPAGAVIGVVAVGLAWRPTWNMEWGSGRPIDDTSTVERLFGGGFGIDAGTVFTGLDWTFGDLLDVEVRQLYRIVRQLGKARSLLVIEDPDPTDGLNERLHWSLFAKLDKFERNAPENTRWAFSVTDWA